MLPQVRSDSPSRAESKRLSSTGRSSLSLPSLCPSSPAECELGDEQNAFVASFGSLATEKTSSQNSQVQLASILSSFKFFQDLDPGVQSKLPGIISIMSKRAGTVMFRQGDPPGNCYVVLQGLAGIFVKSEEDSPADDEDSPRDNICGTRTVEGFSTYHEDSNLGQRIGALGPGTLVGELALLNDQTRSASIKCLQATDFLVIRRCDFDNVLKEDMMRKGDDKFRFLMEHVPGMRDVPVPKPGRDTKPHASYFFKLAIYKRGHCFFEEGAVAESSIMVLYKGSVECRRSEFAPPGVGTPLPSSSKSTPTLLEALPGGVKLGNYRRTPESIARSCYQAKLNSLAREQPMDEVVNRLGVLVPGSVFGSLPLSVQEPFTMAVTSQQCEVFICSGSDLSKLPRKLLDTTREYIAHQAAYRLKYHNQCQDLRRSRPPKALDKLSKKRQNTKSTPTLARPPPDH